MKQSASYTALATAYMRAAHQLLDDEPRILDDDAILHLLGSAAPDRIRADAGRLQADGGKLLRSHVVIRSRYAEDCLAQAVRRGVTQYVLLGAGLDTFAFRQPSWARQLRIFEFDHPATQALKLQRMQEAAFELPPNTVLAAVDFETESLSEKLAAAGVSSDQPTFFAWLGVVMYLHEAAIDATLRMVASYPPGSELVLTFLRHPRPDSKRAGMFREFADHVANAGEPFVTFFEPEQLEAKLLSTGFSSVEFLSADEARSRYFQGRKQDLPVPEYTGVASALV